jgi:Cu(I)/Ag(I) efflux system membrane fusion protein
VWLRAGQKVDFQVEAFPGETFQGRITFIDPIFDASTRTVKVGVIAPETAGRLKPEMIARGTIHATLGSEGRPHVGEGQPSSAPLVVPATAPLVTGKRAIAYVAVPDGDGIYEGREIALGPKAGEYYVVREGLTEGERVVVNGSFKIDSAAQILAQPSMMQPRPQ